MTALRESLYTLALRQSAALQPQAQIGGWEAH
jgi:hypothetical protein